MKTLWVLRHGDNVLDQGPHAGTWQPHSPLSEKGREIVKYMRDTYLVGRNFSFLGTSPFLRALETAKITVPDGAWNEFPLLAPRLHQAWDTLFSTRDPTPTTLQQIEELWPRLVDVEAEWIYEGATRALNFLEEGEHALLVSHQPLIGLLRGQFDPRFGLYDQTLEKGGIYKITVRDDGPSMSEEINPPT